MHKIAEKEFTLEDFSCEHLCDYETSDMLKVNGDEWDGHCVIDIIIRMLNFYRDLYLQTKTKPMKNESERAKLMKKYWWQMIQLLPSSYNQKRTVMLNYEVLANIYKSRKNHKLDEWREFCQWIETLPYSELITGEREP